MKLLFRICDKIRDSNPLDGNGQLFLALQDVSMRNFLRDLDGVTG